MSSRTRFGSRPQRPCAEQSEARRGLPLARLIHLRRRHANHHAEIALARGDIWRRGGWCEVRGGGGGGGNRSGRSGRALEAELALASTRYKPIWGGIRPRGSRQKPFYWCAIEGQQPPPPLPARGFPRPDGPSKYFERAFIRATQKSVKVETLSATG
ncbi:unnamed protein product, partial [Iphiclides podalirius]